MNKENQEHKVYTEECYQHEKCMETLKENQDMKKYLFRVKKTIIGKYCLPLNGFDIFMALIFGTIFLPIMIIFWLLRSLMPDN